MKPYKHPKAKKIQVINSEGKVLGVFPSMTAAARATGVKVQNVWKVCQGYRSTLNGFVFKFWEEE